MHKVLGDSHLPISGVDIGFDEAVLVEIAGLIQFVRDSVESAARDEGAAVGVDVASQCGNGDEVLGLAAEVLEGAFDIARTVCGGGLVLLECVCIYEGFVAFLAFVVSSIMVCHDENE
jgi:hypothetical protein